SPVILGIGINLNQRTRDFQIGLRSIATSCYLVSGRKMNKTLFFQRLLNELEKTYRWVTKRDFDRVLSQWREHSVTLGKRVQVAQTGGIFSGKAVDIDGFGALLVRTDEGNLERVLSGDVEMIGNKGKKRSS